MNQSDKDFHIDIFIDDYQKLSDDFTYIQRNSIFIMTFSVFENELNSICKVLGRNSNLKLAPTDLNGRGIERSKLYLEKVVEINFPKDSTLWAEIKNNNHIRNLAVHNEGQFKENDKNSETKVDK
jgi:hypothetical protein